MPLTALKAPAQRMTDFLHRRLSSSLPSTILQSGLDLR